MQLPFSAINCSRIDWAIRAIAADRSNKNNKKTSGCVCVCAAEWEAVWKDLSYTWMATCLSGLSLFFLTFGFTALQSRLIQFHIPQHWCPCTQQSNKSWNIRRAWWLTENFENWRTRSSAPTQPPPDQNQWQWKQPLPSTENTIIHFRSLRNKNKNCCCCLSLRAHNNYGNKDLERLLTCWYTGHAGKTTPSFKALWAQNNGKLPDISKGFFCSQ